MRVTRFVRPVDGSACPPRPNAAVSARGLRWAIGLCGLLCALLPHASLAAQRVDIRILDARQLPVPYANVQVGGVLRALADSAGRAPLTWSFGNRALLRVTRVGFAPFEVTVSRPARDTTIEVRMESAEAPSLEAVVTTAPRHDLLARKGFYDRMQRTLRGAGSGDFITPEELSMRNPSRVSDVLRGRRSISVGRSSRGGGSGWPVVYGRAGCVMEVVIDGMRMTRGETTYNGYGYVDDVVSGREVLAIEIYHSANSIPGEISPLGSACGAVVIWTGGRP
jgi:hypothetical protein